MKKLLLILYTTMFCLTAAAQLNKGGWLAGGTAGFFYNSTSLQAGSTNNTETTVQISPVAGYFVFNKFCIGLRPALTSSTSKQVDTLTAGPTKVKTTLAAYSVAPFIRYYFLPKSSKVNLIADISYDYYTGKTSYYANQQFEGAGTINWHSYALSAGPVFFITQKTAIEVTASYALQSEKPTPFTTNVFMLNAGFEIYLGK